MKTAMVRLLSVTLALTLLLGAAGHAAETTEQRDARMKWWREARFGMFVHWGIYSVPAGTWQGKQVQGIGEWIMNRGKIPVAAYAGFASQFNPVKFDAGEWVKLAREAGVKYIVITSKHHDGFAMFRSRASRYNICDATPFKRDPLAELATACQQQGIKLGFYYSQAQDWHHPGGAAAGGHWDPAQDGNMDDYLDKVAVPQVREILANYPISILWWDTPVDMTPARAEKFLPLLKVRPDLITNNRLCKEYPGDTETPEQFVPATGIPGRDFEVCMTMNDTWGFKSYDNNWKSAETLIRNLIDIASKGGNYLLNVGPTSLGEIPPASVERLKAMGDWMKVNGEAIYATNASPFKRLPWGRCTRQPGRLYLHVFDWPADGKLTLPLKNPIKKAWLLADPARTFECAASDDGALIQLTGAAPNPVASVVVAEVEGVVEPLPLVMKQDKAGALTLEDADAAIDGQPIKMLGLGNKSQAFWITPGDNKARWDALITLPGTFRVRIEYGCDDASAGGEYVLTVGERSFTGKVQSTGGWDKTKTFTLGRVRIPSNGPLQVTLEAKTKKQRGLMSLHAIKLVPTEKLAPPIRERSKETPKAR